MLDTDTCIAFLKGEVRPPRSRIQAKAIGSCAISSITLAELYAGVAKSEQSHRNADSLERFLAPLQVAPFDRIAAVVYGAIRARLERRGTPIGPMDMLIAAHAMSINVTLVTHNTREYERLADLQVEDWMNGN
jgi:tRNA(fMet)-specific endonuclease VapC